MKSFLKSTVFFVLVITNLTPILASENDQFTIDYDIEYSVEENGQTQITQNTIITNLKNDAVPTNYSFTAKNLDIFDVTAITNGNETDPIVEVGKDETVISVTISNHAIGEGRQNRIQLSYKTEDIANKMGKIWNIYIPRIQIPKTTTLYNVKLSIPESFGNKIYLSPDPVIERVENNKKTFYLTKETFTESGITAAFGEYQLLNFKLKYQLENPTILPLIREIAFPPDIENVQQVSYSQISPKPKRIKRDEDGNVIAWYILGPKKDLEIELTGTARVSGKQINTSFGRSFNDLPSDLVKKYTTSERFWEVDSENIQSLAQKLRDEEQNITQNAQRMYEYVINNLTYDFKALEEGLVERKGAEAALTQKGNYTCMEYTDLFITLSRAMGIPAREINGYAFTNNKTDRPVSINLRGGDLLHSWAEFYDPFYGWIQVDPTWGSTSGVDYFTKLDTNHFAFVIKGVDSEYPYPAGAYRFSESERLVEVELSQNENEESFTPNLETKKVFNFNIFKLIKGIRKYKVINNGGVYVYNLEGKDIPPIRSEIIYIPKNIKTVSYEDINGNKYTLNF